MRRPLALLALVGAPACGPIPRDNPYDIGAPIAVQARAQLAVTVVVGDGVTDPVEPFAGATVVLRGGATGGTHERPSDAVGLATFADLVPDTYAIVAKATGYYSGTGQAPLYPGTHLTRIVTLTAGSAAAQRSAAPLR